MLLAPDDYSLAAHLLDGDNGHYPLLKSVLQGDMQGDVFVDDSRRAKAVLVINRLNWVYFFGSEDCGGFLCEVPDILKRKEGGSYIWFGASDGWERRLRDSGFNDIRAFPRFRFQFEPERFAALSGRAVPVEIYAVDDPALDDILPRYYSNGWFWDSRQRFLEKGFGFYVKEEGQVASVVMSAAVVDGEAEVDIQTDGDYRGSGYAEALSMVFIRACINKGLIPKWDCYHENVPSINLAQKLGFVRQGQYPLLYITP